MKTVLFYIFLTIMIPILVILSVLAHIQAWVMGDDEFLEKSKRIWKIIKEQNK